jgi:dTMP kinase
MGDSMRGKLIVFEGIDGSGKSTQRGLYAAYMRGRGLQERLVTTTEPYGMAGALIRRVLGGDCPMLNSSEELARLFAASRWEHAREVLRPALEAGQIILCDRYLPSSYAYQGAGCGPNHGWIERIRGLNADIPVPTITLVFDVSAETAAGRIAERKGQASEIFDRSTLAEIRQRAAVYDRLGEYPGVGLVHYVLGAGPPEEVQKSVRAVLDPIVFGGEV